jgi:hypothetical protein
MLEAQVPYKSRVSEINEKLLDAKEYNFRVKGETEMISRR